MTIVARRIPAAALVAGIAALALSGCIAPPPAAPPAPPSTAPATPPTESTDPVETSAAPSTDATPQPSAATELPELVALNTPLPAGAQAGWETGIIVDDAFRVEPDSTFPEGPTISVTEVATGCTFWAYQGTQDSDATDEAENSAFTLGEISNSSPDDWEPDIVELGPSSQGATVEFLSVIDEYEDGSSEAWFSRNFQSSRTTSSIIAFCPAGAGGIDHIDQVVGEQLQINFRIP